MKKFILSSILVLSSLALVACSSNSDSQTKTSTSETASSTSQTSTTPSVDNSQYDSLISSLKNQFNSDGSNQMDISIENNVIDSDYPKGHNIIRVLLKGEAKTNMETLIEAIDSNTADKDQKNAITLLQMAISQIAKELPDDTTTLTFGYELSPQQYRIIANSSKEKDIIPVGDLVLQ